MVAVAVKEVALNAVAEVVVWKLLVFVVVVAIAGAVVVVIAAVGVAAKTRYIDTAHIHQDNDSSSGCRN